MKNLIILITLSNLLISTSAFAQVVPTPNSAGSGNCLEFDGADDFVGGIGDVTDYSFIQNTGVFTIEGWIQLNNPFNNTWGSIFSTSSTGSHNGFAFGFENRATVGAQQLLMHMNNGAGYVINNGLTSPLSAMSAINIINDTEFHHVVVVGDAVNIIFYIDGVLSAGDGTMTILATGNSTNLAEIGSVRNPFQIGGRYGYFDGRIDEVRVWNIARTQTQIRDNMCHALTGTEPGLVGYWPMDAMGTTCGGATEVCDISGNGNNGTRQN